MFSWAAISLGIGTHSSLKKLKYFDFVNHVLDCPFPVSAQLQLECGPTQRDGRRPP